MAAGFQIFCQVQTEVGQTHREGLLQKGVENRILKFCCKTADFVPQGLQCELFLVLFHHPIPIQMLLFSSRIFLLVVAVVLIVLMVLIVLCMAFLNSIKWTVLSCYRYLQTISFPWLWTAPRLHCTALSCFQLITEVWNSYEAVIEKTC